MLGHRLERGGTGEHVVGGEVARFDGPIPLMLQSALEWALRQMPRDLAETAEGTPAWRRRLPAVAIREILANALVHRDLAPWSLSRGIELRLDDRGLVVTNPGGLYGVSEDLLGTEELTSARNAILIRICQYVQAGG